MSIRRSVGTIVGSLLLASTAMQAGAGPVSASGRTIVVDGVTVHLGVVSCEVIARRSKSESESQMHGGVPSIPDCHHVMVALFDRNTGKRIDDAKVFAWVHEPGMSGALESLNPMPVSGVTTYGNFFSMEENETYQIHLRIGWPGRTKMQEVDFEYSDISE